MAQDDSASNQSERYRSWRETYHSRGEYEDERRLGSGVVDDLTEVEDWRLDELGPEVVDDERRHAERHAVLPQRSDQQHPLQLVARTLPLACHIINISNQLPYPHLPLPFH